MSANQADYTLITLPNYTQALSPLLSPLLSSPLSSSGLIDVSKAEAAIEMLEK